MQEIFGGVFFEDRKLFTENSVPGYKPFDEELVKRGKREFRTWNPRRSKLGAAIVKGIKSMPIKKGDKILYLGAAHGMTPTFVANIVKESGILYAVEFSDRCFNNLLPICEKYTNITPIMADARKPEEYYWIEKVDVVFIDVAQPDETEIAIRNCKEFLKPGGYLLMAIKSRSIDVTKSPGLIYKEEMAKLRKGGFEIIDWKTLDPLEKAHAFIVAKSKD
ncbi:MAG: fibrillarin-like rRNA/tRNA 2'-O-methyltransferase [Candidatus Aenigmarchaeota archaeon]|nr:fibrillarin-like rRNA/tRNA 2'-O-methyltransferase [Candidatus Aenigmarchaeota archaeon]